MKKIKITFILTVLGMGGAEKIVSLIVNHLDRKKYQIQLILFHENEFNYMIKDDVEIFYTQTKRIRSSLFPILKILWNQKPDLVFSSYGEVNAYLAPFIPFFKNTKFIARETNVVSQHVTRPEIKFFYNFYKNFDRIICQSSDMFQDLEKNFGIKPLKMELIHNPVDFQNIETLLKGQSTPKEYFKNAKNVLAIGNLSARKGFDNLLRVFEFLKEENIHLHILGDGRDRDKLEDQKRKLKLDRVHFHGIRKNPFPYLKYADLFVLSSRYEGFPNVLLEAGACGTFSVANDCPGGIREIIQPNINGIYTRIDNLENFASVIWKNLKITHNSTNIKKAIYDRYNKEIILNEYESIFQDLLFS